jgi:small conductance mechanosensitive channel
MRAFFTSEQWRSIERWLYEHGLMIVAVVAGMLALLWVARILERRIIALVTRSTEHGTPIERENRARTLVGAFHNAASTAIVIGGLLMVLAQLSVEVGVLLGAAGVAGLALAFGAQNLMRDYFYGFFILLENQYTINDVVRIGETTGQVERITLRITVLRSLDGAVHFIPNGQINKVTNLTHEWSRAVVEIGVGFGEDLDRVMDAIAELGKELRGDPAIGPLILEDLQMLGVDAIGDSAVVIKFFIKTRPLQQWTVKRETLRRIKRRFDELKIEIPFPHRTVINRREREPGDQ